MIQSRVFTLKADHSLSLDLNFKAGREFEIVMDVVYMEGFPLPEGLQPMFYKWIVGNPSLFIDTTKNW